MKQAGAFVLHRKSEYHGKAGTADVSFQEKTALRLWLCAIILAVVVVTLAGSWIVVG